MKSRNILLLHSEIRKHPLINQEVKVTKVRKVRKVVFIDD